MPTSFMFGLAVQLAINIKCEINDVWYARDLNYIFIHFLLRY